MISVKFVYNDGKDLHVNIPDEEFEKLFHELSQNKPYWDKDIRNGFWTNLQDVRFIQFEVKEVANEPEQKRAGETSCSGAECKSSGTGEDSPPNESGYSFH